MAFAFLKLLYQFGRFTLWAIVIGGAISNVVQLIAWLADLIPDREMENIIFIGDVYKQFS